MTFSKYLFLKENVCIIIHISLKFIPDGPVDTEAYIQVIAWHQIGNTP